VRFRKINRLIRIKILLTRASSDGGFLRSFLTGRFRTYTYKVDGAPRLSLGTVPGFFLRTQDAHAIARFFRRHGRYATRRIAVDPPAGTTGCLSFSFFSRHTSSLGYVVRRKDESEEIDSYATLLLARSRK